MVFNHLGSSYEREVLPGLNDYGITIEIAYHRNYKAVPKKFDNDEKKDLKKVINPFPETKLLVYFLLMMDGEDYNFDNLPVKFDPPVYLKVTYTETAWNDAIKNGYERPRLAYLVRKESCWASQWIEFDKEITAVIPPDMCGDSNGYIHLTIKKLEDPLIGGC